MSKKPLGASRGVIVFDPYHTLMTELIQAAARLVQYGETKVSEPADHLLDLLDEQLVTARKTLKALKKEGA